MPFMALKQFASYVLSSSSQYNEDGWSAEQALGSPKVFPRYGDIQGSWAPQKKDNKQFLELGFVTPVFVDAINIYETYNAGGVVDVEVLSPEGSWLSVWQADHPMVITTSRMFSVPIEKAPPFRVSALKLHVDCTASGTWVEIDAVELVGRIVDTAPPPDVAQLQEDLARLVNDKDTSDISFNIEGQTLYAHRGILSVRSQYFSVLCKDSTLKMDAIWLEGVSSQAFNCILHYLYTNKFPATADPVTMVSVWRAACLFNMKDGQSAALHNLVNTFRVPSVVSVYKEAIREPPIESVLELCYDFMSQNLKDLALDQSFKDLERADMIGIIQQATARMSVSKRTR